MQKFRNERSRVLSTEARSPYLEFVPALHVLFALLGDVVVLVLDVSNGEGELVLEELASVSGSLSEESLQFLHLLLVDSEFICSNICIAFFFEDYAILFNFIHLV